MNFLPILLAVQTIFASAFGLLSSHNQEFITDNIWGVYVIEPGEIGHPSYYHSHAYTVGHVLYIGSDTWGQVHPLMLAQPVYDAGVLCHEAAHGSRAWKENFTIHDHWLYSREFDCQLDAVWKLNKWKGRH